MGKGTKKKTVWRTFSFENGDTNGTDADTTNGHTALHHQKNDGVNSNDVSNRSSISNGKFTGCWRTQRNDDDNVNENDPSSKLLDANGNVNGYIENGHRSYFKRSPLTDKYPLRGTGLRKAPPYFQENGNKSDFHDIYENSTKPSQFRSNRLSKVPASRHTNYKKWDSRIGNYNSNGILSNYSRGFRKSHFAHSDQAATAAAMVSNEIPNNTDEHFHENGLTKNARNADDSDKCQDKANGSSSAQLLHDQADQHRCLQRNNFNEDEYTRISTPRSEVLFKKGYLMRDKKYVGPTNTISTTGTSSNDSGSVSVVSNEETASYYSIQSMSPDDSTYPNGNNSSDSTSATYPNDGFEHDLSLIYSSGFYDNSGYFYVNPYIHNNFDQFNGPTILMPYGSAPNTKDIDAYDADADADAYSQAPLSPTTGDTKSIDGEHANNCNSINSEEMSSSSLSENISINNDPDTPPNPLTPPPSPLSPNEKPIARAEAPEDDKPLDDSEIENVINPEATVQNGQAETELVSDDQDEVPDADAVVPDNYSMPYFSPFIFVPPIPFVPDARMASSRRGRFRRHLNNQFGRSKRNNRFSHFYNKVYVPSNWSEAPDEATPNDINDDDIDESKLNDGKSADTTTTPTIEQCDTILKNSKLNLNVSEFIPQSKRMIFVQVPITPSPPASIYFVPIPSTESTLNVNVPEFLPKNYKPLNEEESDGNMNSNTTSNNINEPALSIMISGDVATIVTNESAENQNETTNNHTNGLGNDDVCTENAENVASTTANGVQHSQILANGTESQSEQTVVAASIMSDLLKNNSDNINLDARSFNKENSHTNLKADLGSKKVTNNISKNKVYKNDNYCNDSDSSKNHKINSSSKHAKTRHAYPKTKQPTVWESLASSKTNQPADADGQHVADIGCNEDAKSVEKLNEKPGLTYAQMVVPVKASATSPHILANTVEAKAETPKSPPKTKSSQNGPSNGNVDRRTNSAKKKVATGSHNERPVKLIENSVEWFTIGAKGRKHITPNGSTVTEIAFENESKVEKVNKIAEELQLDINKDPDLAMDIMDSLTINEEKSEDKTATKAPKKKKMVPSTSKSKKKPKEKLNKEQKRRDTFDIIEPNFEEQINEELPADDGTSEHSEVNIEINSQNECSDKSIDSDQTFDEFVFDPNVFATPCNLQMDSLPRSSTGELGKSLRLTTGKPVRNLINQFDIYQKDYTSIENQQLKQEEEMVIKILQQLNKSMEEKEEHHKNNDAVMMVDVESIVSTPSKQPTESIKEVTPARENSVERFAINAKPYQNVYASNHFLEHFFGDRNDIRDQVVPSTNLSSSDQSNVEQSVVDNLNTYPAIDVQSEECFPENEPEPDLVSDIQVKTEGEANIYEFVVDCEPTETVEVQKMECKQNCEDECVDEVDLQSEQMLENETEEMPPVEINRIAFEQPAAIQIENTIEIEQLEATVEHTSAVSLEHEVETLLESSFEDKSVKFENGSPEKTETKAFEIKDDGIQMDTLNEPNDASDVRIESICNTVYEAVVCEIPESVIRITPPELVEEVSEQKDSAPHEIESEPISIETEVSSIGTEPVSSVSCNQSIKSNSSNGRPWLRIVDTQMLQNEKKLQQTFPITSAVSMWLQAQKEKTPEPVLRIPDYRFFAGTTKHTKTDSQASYSNSSIDLTEDTASITSSDNHMNDDEEEDIMNFYESPLLLSPQSPTITPPPIYNSVYGSSINYTNLLSNKNELLCNNIIDFDQIEAANGKMSENANEKSTLNLNINGFNQNGDTATEKTTGADEKSFRPPPEVCCSIM